MGIPILRLKDADGNVVPVPAIQGADGKSAYEFALEGGYTGSEEEFADTTNELVHVSSSTLGEDSIRQICAHPLSDIYTEVLNMKINELKEISGNRDFTQGSTNGGRHGKTTLERS